MPTRADAEHYLRELAGRGRRDGRARGALRRADRGGSSAAPACARPALGGLARERLIAALLRARRTPARLPGAGARAWGRCSPSCRCAASAPRGSRGARRWPAADGPAPRARSSAGCSPTTARALERLGRLDAEQRAVRALDALRRSPALWGRTPVLFYGFDDLTPLQLDAIETLGRVVGAPVTVSLTFEPGRVGVRRARRDLRALAPLADEHRALAARAEYYAPQARAALGHLERSLFEPGAARVDPADGRAPARGGRRARRARARRARRSPSCSRRAWRPRRSRSSCARRARAPTCSKRCSPTAGIPFALERRRAARRHRDRARADRPAALRARRRGRAAPTGELGDLLAWLRAPGLLERPELADSAGAHARGARAR